VSVSAKDSRLMFATAKKGQLALVRTEQRTQRQVMKALRKLYDKLLAAYLRGEGTTYAAWLVDGPKADWDELVHAAEEPAVWDRLVEVIGDRA
jgi:hypothetical protein